MDINYELYKVFYYVATSLSFSEASKKLFISQSAVSQSIKTLEKKLGQTLFIRSTKKVQLTAAGTRRDDLLLDKTTLDRMWILRKYLADMNPIEAMDFVKDRLEKTRDNDEFLMSMNS